MRSESMNRKVDFDIGPECDHVDHYVTMRSEKYDKLMELLDELKPLMESIRMAILMGFLSNVQSVTVVEANSIRAYDEYNAMV